MLSLLLTLSISLPGAIPEVPVDSFPLPSVPAYITEPEARAELVVSHFFDHAILPDSPSQSLEVAIANFTTVAPLASEDARRKAATTIFEHAITPAKAETLRNTIEQYLFSADSPYLNLDLFALFLEADRESVRRDGLLELITPNRIGSRATDIPLLTSADLSTNLSDLLAAAPQTLLVFFDPECENCRELTMNMSRDSTISEAVEKGGLTIIAVTPGGETPVVPDYFPKEWIVAVDADDAISENDLYFIPSYPEVYLISREDMKVEARGLRSVDDITSALRQ